MGILAGFIAAFVSLMVIIGLIYIADVSISLLDNLKSILARTFKVYSDGFYSEKADSATSVLVYVVAGMVIFIVVGFAIHVKKR